MHACQAVQAPGQGGPASLRVWHPAYFDSNVDSKAVAAASGERPGGALQGEVDCHAPSGRAGNPPCQKT